MNIFVLDRDIDTCVSYHCDKHVVKMVLETAQILCSPFKPGHAPYKRTHYNHPCSQWARASLSNYKWLCNFGSALADEYTRRYDKKHKSRLVIRWCLEHINELSLPDTEMTEFAQAMPVQYRTKDAVEAYRNYYMGDKREIATWKNKIPEWWK